MQSRPKGPAGWRGQRRTAVLLTLLVGAVVLCCVALWRFLADGDEPPSRGTVAELRGRAKQLEALNLEPQQRRGDGPAVIEASGSTVPPAASNRMAQPPAALDKLTQMEFTNVYTHEMWSSDGGGSGSGSTLSFTGGLRTLLKHFIKERGIHSMIDLPCGATVWTTEFLQSDAPADLRYHGGDIVAHVVEANQKKWEHDPLKTFSVWDLASTPVPSGFDLILSRDALQHLPYRIIFDSLHQFSRSDAKYLLVGSYPHGRNIDLRTPGAHVFEINLARSPFNLRPDEVFEEALPEERASRRLDGFNKHLYLYRVSELRKIDFRALAESHERRWEKRRMYRQLSLHDSINMSAVGLHYLSGPRAKAAYASHAKRRGRARLVHVR